MKMFMNDSNQNCLKKKPRIYSYHSEKAFTINHTIKGRFSRSLYVGSKIEYLSSLSAILNFTWQDGPLYYMERVANIGTHYLQTLLPCKTSVIFQIFRYAIKKTTSVSMKRTEDQVLKE